MKYLLVILAINFIIGYCYICLKLLLEKDNEVKRFKNKTNNEIFYILSDEILSADENQEMIVYCCLNTGKKFVCRKNEFYDKFEEIKNNKR